MISSSLIWILNCRLVTEYCYKMHVLCYTGTIGDLPFATWLPYWTSSWTALPLFFHYILTLVPCSNSSKVTHRLFLRTLCIPRHILYRTSMTVPMPAGMRTSRLVCSSSK